MYTEFGNMRNFYLLLISFSSSTLLYVINVPQYHLQIHPCKEHAQKLCMSKLNLVTTFQIMQESTVLSVFFRIRIMSSGAARG